MFNPSRDQARQFFIDAWDKSQTGNVLSPLEAIAANLVGMHPEYHAVLESGEAAIARDWTPEMGESNPFLHLSLHMAIEEQLSIDQPPGIRGAFEFQCLRLQDRHAALHVVLDSLAETIWRSQREGTPLDGAGYVAAVRNKT